MACSHQTCLEHCAGLHLGTLNFNQFKICKTAPICRYGTVYDIHADVQGIHADVQAHS